jgi:hypothetical protein
MVNVERIKVGNRQTIDTLISEEALLFAKYLRNERRMDTQNRNSLLKEKVENPIEPLNKT